MQTQALNLPQARVIATEPGAQPSLLQIAEQGLALAARGSLQLIDLLNAAQQLTEARQTDIAIQLYRVWLAHTTSPLAYAVHFNLGALLANTDAAGAEAAYRASIALNPAFAESHFNLALLLERMQRSDEAVASWRAFISTPGAQSSPLHTQALNSLARLLELRGESAAAESMLVQSLKQDPAQTEALAHWIRLRQQLCAWPVFGELPGISPDAMLNACAGESILSLSDDPSAQLAIAKRHVEKTVLKDARPMCARLSYGHERLRIGYLYADDCAAGTTVSAAVLAGQHDRHQVEVFGFSWQAKPGSSPRDTEAAAFDHQIRLDHLTDEEAAREIRKHEIDVLLDLNGLISGARPDILSYRPAPLQISWPGLPGTSALPGVDYIIANEFSLPAELEAFFTEKPLHLPGTLMATRRLRGVEEATHRAVCGLPQEAMVFCCFCDSQKITQNVFETWMRILKRVPDSVLWLVADSERVRENLFLHADRCCVPRERLIFSKHLSPAEQFAQLALADLFLDTAPFSSDHAASNALWVGLPLLSCVGRSLASRTAGSLLQAAGLTELICHTLQDYEDKAVALAENKPRIAAMKKLLVEQRQHGTLFDLPYFVRELETQCQRLSDTLPLRTVQTSFEAALTQIKRAPAPCGVKNPVGDRYVIVAPPFQHNSAGIRVLYDLQKWLVLEGLDAIVCTWFQGYPIEQFENDIVIYPEVAPGNILKARRVIRYILNTPGKLGHGEKTYDRNELLICYNLELAHFADGAILQVPAIEPFFNADNAMKTCDAVFTGKGVNLGLHPAGCVEITKAFPPTRRETAALLRSVKTLYTYDDFSMIAEEARLCGCKVKLIQKSGVISDYPHKVFPTLTDFKTQLQAFIEVSKCL